MSTRYLNVNQTIDWLNRYAQIGSLGMKADKKFLKKLDDTCRLLPDKTSFFGRKYYSVKHLRQYANDVRPR